VKIANHFLAKHHKKCKRRVHGISRQAIDHLMHYDWPGNVRELENAIERAVVLGVADLILPDDLPEGVLESATLSDAAGVSGGYHDAVPRRKSR
jgi:DNA-binding NtrC family response regulator